MEKRKYRSREDWKALIEAQRASGLSAAEFCRQQQINAKYFSKHKTEYMRLVGKSEMHSAFVKVQPPAQATEPLNIHLHYRQIHVQIPSAVGSAWLADFLMLLS